MGPCRSVLRVMFVLALSGVPAVAQLPPAEQGGPGEEVVLETALARAMAESPVLARATAAVGEARGRLVAAGTYPDNPRVELEGADRRPPDGGSTTDRGVALSQRFEIAGQRAKRVAQARADLAAAEEREARVRREVRSAVARSFAETIRARELLAVAAADVDLTANLLSLEERRLEAGAGTRIEVNLARAAAGRAVHRLQTARAGQGAARARLAEAIGADPSVSLRAAGELPGSAKTLPALEELLRRALAERSDLAALRHERDRDQRRVALERARAIPDLELGAFASREEGDDVVGLRLGIAVPLFNRNQGAVVEAASRVARRGAALRAAELAVRREVTVAYGRYRAAARAVEALRDLVIDTLAESLELLRKAVAAGKLSTTDVLLLRRELVDGQREQIEAAGELWLARAELELAVGGDLFTTPAGTPRGDER